MQCVCGERLRQKGYTFEANLGNLARTRVLKLKKDIVSYNLSAYICMHVMGPAHVKAIEKFT